jgi:hypothetical protein
LSAYVFWSKAFVACKAGGVAAMIVAREYDFADHRFGLRWIAASRGAFGARWGRDHRPITARRRKNPPHAAAKDEKISYDMFFDNSDRRACVLTR